MRIIFPSFHKNAGVDNTVGFLQLTRKALLSDSDFASVLDGAIRLLTEVGVEIAHLELRTRAQQHGFLIEQDRVRFSRNQVMAIIDESKLLKRHRLPALREDNELIQLHLTPNPYPQNIHDLESGHIVPLTCARLETAAKLVDVLRDRGIAASLPGCPCDVPPQLQVLAQYRIGVRVLRGWQGPVDFKTLPSLPYVMEMAEVMGTPIRGLPVYVFSPLRLAGESLTAIMQLEDKLESIYIGSMPAAGCTAPIHPVEALALATAEVIGSALILQDCIKPQVYWSVGIFPFDLRGMAMSFGSPESILLEMASHEVNAFLHGKSWWPATGSLLTLAKLPDQQAIAEKTSAMTLGAALGARFFEGAGTLALDEVFSPIQLLMDVEIKDHVERLMNGLSTHCSIDVLIHELQNGATRGFTQTDSSLDCHKELYWYPRLFERRFLAPWQMAGSPLVVEKAAAEIRTLVESHTYSPPQAIVDELDRIYLHAEKELVNQ